MTCLATRHKGMRVWISSHLDRVSSGSMLWSRVPHFRLQPLDVLYMRGIVALAPTNRHTSIHSWCFFILSSSLLATSLISYRSDRSGGGWVMRGCLLLLCPRKHLAPACVAFSECNTVNEILSAMISTLPNKWLHQRRAQDYCKTSLHRSA